MRDDISYKGNQYNKGGIIRFVVQMVPDLNLSD